MSSSRTKMHQVQFRLRLCPRPRGGGGAIRYLASGRWGPLYSWLGCLAGRCASLCLHAARGGCAIGDSG